MQRDLLSGTEFEIDAVGEAVDKALRLEWEIPGAWVAFLVATD